MVGLWTIRLLIQVHSIGYSFALACNRYDNHNCHNKPQRGNGAEVWMTSCPEVMVPRIWGFWKRLQFGVDCGPGNQTIESLPLGHRELGSLAWSWDFEVGPSSWKVDFGPCRQTVGLSAIEADGWEVEFWLWCWEVGVRPDSWEFC